MHPPFFAVDHRVDNASLPPHERRVTRYSTPERLVIHSIGPTSGYYLVGTLGSAPRAAIARTETDPTADPRFAPSGGGGLIRRVLSVFGAGAGPTRSALR